tara:strand:- start:938 stop:1834 length:897 start_codon:yes stop_codon:yes gene_type:complete
MVVCAPCLLPVVKAGAVGLTSMVGYSKVRDRQLSKKLRRKKKTRRKKKNTRRKKKKTKKVKSQRGGSGMTETLDEYYRDSNEVFTNYLKEQLQNKKECEKKLGLGVQIRSDKNQPVDENEVIHILNGCKYYERCQPCDTYLKESEEAPTLSSPPQSRIKYLPPPVPIAARRLSMKNSIDPRISMLMTAVGNRTKAKKLQNRRRSKHLREAMDRRRKRTDHIRKLRRTRSALFGGGKEKYGIKNNKVVTLYPHKIKTPNQRHNYKLLWKTTKNNLPRKTFHGKFYNSKEEAMKNIKTKK